MPEEQEVSTTTGSSNQVSEEIQQQSESNTDSTSNVEDGISGGSSNPDPTEPSTETPTEPTSDEPFVWDGGVENLPKELQSRGKGMLEHMHKVTQEAAQVKREAEAYNQIINHPEFKEFLEWQDKKKDSLPPAGPASPQITEEELLAAQTDPQHFNDLLNKGINAAVQPLAQEAMKQINQLKYELELSKKERELEAFAQTHEGFEDMMKDKARSSIMQAIIQDVVGKNKGTLEDAWVQYQSLDKAYLDKAQSQINKTIKSKKAAVTTSPSKAGSPNVIYVDNADEATRVAYENAKLGKRVDVRVRRGKK